MSDFVQRLKEEISDLKNKLEKLKNFLNSDRSGLLSTRRHTLMNEQERLQSDLLLVLEEHLKIITGDTELSLGKPVTYITDFSNASIRDSSVDDNDTAINAAKVANSSIGVLQVDESTQTERYSNSTSFDSYSDSSSSYSSDFSCSSSD